MWWEGGVELLHLLVGDRVAVDGWLAWTRSCSASGDGGLDLVVSEAQASGSFLGRRDRASIPQLAGQLPLGRDHLPHVAGPRPFRRAILLDDFVQNLSSLFGRNGAPLQQEEQRVRDCSLHQDPLAFCEDLLRANPDQVVQLGLGERLAERTHDLPSVDKSREQKGP